VGLLQQHLALVNAQVALNTAQQTQEAQLAKAVTEALKNQATEQFALESEQAKLPLAELAGVQAALGNAQLPTGKSGTVQVAAGVAGTQLLRSKKPMLELLAEVADELIDQLPDGAVVVTEAQLDQAYQAEITLSLVDHQIQNLEEAIKAASPPTVPAQVAMALPAFAAAAYSLGFVLDTVNSLAKLFRVDRKVDVFAADTEAPQMLGYLLEGRGRKFVANPAMMRDQASTEAETLLDKLNTLLGAVHKGDDLLAQLKKIEEGEAKKKPSSSQLPAASVVTELKAQIEAARSLLDGLHPSKKPDAFWAQVKGQLISSTLKKRDRLLLEAKAQALQITESRWWKSDVVSIGGEVQVAYRILNPDGTVKKADVILKVSKAKSTSLRRLDEMPGFSYPPSSNKTAKRDSS
jgi:hypothetical protein